MSFSFITILKFFPMQKTLMGSFFKSKQTSTASSHSAMENGEGAPLETTEQEEQELTVQSPGNSQRSHDSNSDSSGRGKLTSSQKLASFAFKTA